MKNLLKLAVPTIALATGLLGAQSASAAIISLTGGAMGAIGNTNDCAGFFGDPTVKGNSFSNCDIGNVFIEDTNNDGEIGAGDEKISISPVIVKYDTPDNDTTGTSNDTFWLHMLIHRYHF